MGISALFFLLILILLSIGVLRGLESLAKWIRNAPWRWKLEHITIYSLLILLYTVLAGAVLAPVFVGLLWLFTACLHPWHPIFAHQMMMYSWKPLVLIAFLLAAPAPYRTFFSSSMWERSRIRAESSQENS